MTAPFFDGSQPCATTDPEAWFPDRGGNPRPAKRLCAGCEFREPCLEYALTATVDGEPVLGVWGGTSARQRERIRQGLTTGADRRRNPERDARILALHDEQLTCRQIADRLHLPIYTVYQTLHRHGRQPVPAPKQPRASRRAA